MTDRKTRCEKLCDPTSNRRHSESGLEGVKCATGQMNAGDQATSAKWATGRKNELPLRDQYRIATWNVQGLLQTGKLFILEQELIKQKIDICGIAETHWKDKGHFEGTKYKIFISGAEKTGQKGVAIMVSKKLAQSVYEYLPINERLIMITFNTKPTKLHIFQVYMPTADAEDEQVEEIYKILEETISKIPKKHVVMVMGDWNAKVGETTNDDNLRETVGKYGLGERNARGERLIQFALDHEFTITNTNFKKHSRRLSTWTSPGGRYKNQIDYVLVNKRWKTSIKNVETKPSAECGSDHKLLRAEFKIKFHRTTKTTSATRKVPKDLCKFQLALKNSKTPEATGDPEKTWTNTKQWIFNALDSSNPKETVQTRKHWMTDETMELVEERRELKSCTKNLTDKSQRIAELNTQIKHLCRRDKNKHINSMCNEIQEHADRQEPKELFNKVKYLTREFKAQTQIIKDEKGNIITNLKGIAETWKKYCERLYADTNPEDDIEEITDWEKEPNILRSEVAAAIKRLKLGKSGGEDQITAEAIKGMGEDGTNVIHTICEEIWNTGKWPSDWCKSVFIPIYKKGTPTDCSNYRTIALISHASKVLLNIINERLKVFLLPQISEEQSGFVPGRGTREQILNVRQIVEKTREFNVETYLCFVDYSKAFDCVNWQKMWEILKEMGLPYHLIWLLKQLYGNNMTTVRINNTCSDRFKLGAGVRQGCVLSPLLFNIYSEHIMRTVFDDWDGGIAVGGRKINNLRYADDTLILAASHRELEEIMQKLNNVSQQYGLKINAKKTKVLIIDRARNNQAEVTSIAGYEVVRKFNYLGSIITNNGGCEEEIRRRLMMARSATAKLTKIWKDTDITKATKLRLASTLIFPIATYASETWTIKKADANRINAFEMWVYRRILRIPWTAHRTNESVLQELNINTRLSTIINRNILRYFGHITRRKEGMERLIVEGGVEGRRSRGRSPSRWSDQIKKFTGLSLPEASHKAQYRDEWSVTVKQAS